MLSQSWSSIWKLLADMFIIISSDWLRFISFMAISRTNANSKKPHTVGLHVVFFCFFFKLMQDIFFENPITKLHVWIHHFFSDYTNWKWNHSSMSTDHCSYCNSKVIQLKIVRFSVIQQLVIVTWLLLLAYLSIQNRLILGDMDKKMYFLNYFISASYVYGEGFLQ